jgi:hypothetical protein
VTATLYSTPLLIGSQLADATGRVEFNWTMPASVSFGTHQLVLQGEGSGQVSIPLTYTAQLQNTGADMAQSLLHGGVLALLIGGLCLALSRRNQRQC